MGGWAAGKGWASWPMGWGKVSVRKDPLPGGQSPAGEEGAEPAGGQPGAGQPLCPHVWRAQGITCRDEQFLYQESHICP